MIKIKLAKKVKSQKETEKSNKVWNFYNKIADFIETTLSYAAIILTLVGILRMTKVKIDKYYITKFEQLQQHEQIKIDHEQMIGLNPLEQIICEGWSTEEIETFHGWKAKTLERIMKNLDSADIAASAKIVKLCFPYISYWTSDRLPSPILEGIIALESGGCVKNSSPTGCVGVGQLAKHVAENLLGRKITKHYDPRKDPEQCIRLMAKLWHQIDSILGDHEWNLVAYAIGMPALQRLLKDHIERNIGKDRFKADFGISLDRAIIDKAVIEKYGLNYVKVKSESKFWKSKFRKNKYWWNLRNYLEKISLLYGLTQNYIKNWYISQTQTHNKSSKWCHR